MACKRALVAAVLNGTAASDFFTQDLDDLTEKAAEYTPPAKAGADPKANAGGTAAAYAGSPAATGTTSTPVPNGTTPTSGPLQPAAPTPGTPKPPRANTVRHDGTFARPCLVGPHSPAFADAQRVFVQLVH